VKSHKSKCRDKVVHMHAMRAYGGVEVQLHSFLIWVLDEGGQLRASAAWSLQKEPPLPPSTTG